VRNAGSARWSGNVERHQVHDLVEGREISGRCCVAAHQALHGISLGAVQYPQRISGQQFGSLVRRHRRVPSSLVRA